VTAAPAPEFDLIGIGSPIMDLLAQVPEAFLAHVPGEKGGMVLVEEPEIERLVGLLPTPPAVVSGGSAANTVQAAARLGLRTTLLGQLGDDATATAYRAHATAAGIDVSRLRTAALPNARCLSLVTPDGQRTMRTCLAAAMALDPAHIGPADFAGCRHAHMEGYLLFNRALADAVLAAARAAGCSVSVDLASFEVVGAARDWIFGQLHTGLDLVFANEDEIRALFPDSPAVGTDFPALARRLAAHGVTAAVKLGKDGAWIARGDELHRIAATAVDRVVDSTGAGDFWAAGFLAGHLRGAPLPISGALGSLLGGECVRHLGPTIPGGNWTAVRERARSLWPSAVG
jgi:sugar/nucleoside kinase (ribokinase family)